MASKKMMSLIVVLVITAIAGAVTYTGSIEYTSGSGSNEAIIAIDFDFDNSFLFTYYWDNDANGWDALSAISAAGDLVAETAYGGTFITDLIYPGGVKYDYGSTNSGWAYYTSNDGDIWDYSMVGVAGRTLTNNTWDSWTWTSYSGGESGWDNADRLPGGIPIPEPASMLLLGLGGLLIKRRVGRC